MNQEKILKEVKFKAVRSGGAGGQHVNKVSSKIELTFDVENSNELTAEEKKLIYEKLKSKLSKENLLIINCDETRSQHKNKEIAKLRFLQIIKGALFIPKKRKATKPSKSSIQKRLDKKKKQAYKKALRNRPEF